MIVHTNGNAASHLRFGMVPTIKLADSANEDVSGAVMSGDSVAMLNEQLAEKCRALESLRIKYRALKSLCRAQVLLQQSNKSQIESMEQELREARSATTAAIGASTRPKKLAQEVEHFEEEVSTDDGEPRRRKRGSHFLCEYKCDPPCEKVAQSYRKCKLHGGGKVCNSEDCDRSVESGGKCFRCRNNARDHVAVD
jgi:hypothetical protein